ncbi:Transposase DDE domain-containing protein [Streptomyces sp. cf386]|nr:Transposase DDE domain-containing protein [Streptomyces sp. cf386]
MAEPAHPAGGGGAGGEGLGRSRGGFTSKLHLSADGRCRPLPLVVTPGQRADCTQFQTVPAKIPVPRVGLGRLRTKPDSQAVRLRKGSRGGRPPGFTEERSKKRNTIERAINRLKQSRAVATRYDKRGYAFLGTATTVTLLFWLRS